MKFITVWLHRYFSAASAQILGKLLSIIMGVLLARYLGPEEFGKYSFFMSIVAFCMLFTSFGLPQFLIREVPILKIKLNYAKLKGIVCWSYIVSLIITLAMLAIFLTFLLFFPEKRSRDFIVLICFLLVVIFKVFTNINSGVLNGDKKPFYATLSTNVIYPLICVIFIAYQGEGLKYSSMVFGAVLATMVGFFVSSYYLYHLSLIHWPSGSITFPTNRQFKKLYPFWFLAFLTTFNTEFSGIVLGFGGHTEQLALFKVSMQAITIVTLIFTVISNVNAPFLAESYANDEKIKTQNLLTQSANLGFLGSLPILFSFFAFGRGIFLLVFGEQYLAAYPILLVLLIGQTFRVFMGIPGVALNMVGHEKQITYIMAFTVLLLVVSLLIFVTALGALGAAISVAISTIFWSGVSSYILYKKTGLKTWVNLTLKEK